MSSASAVGLCNHPDPLFVLLSVVGTRYQSLDRGGLGDPHDREFMPIREPRDRSRERSMDRGLYLEDDLYGRPRQSKFAALFRSLGGSLK